jgi:hypothetical protein
MWFEKRSKSVSETEKEPLEHWPTERMVFAGHAEVAMRDDLEGLSNEDLAKVAEICIVNEFAPDECIPCYAHTLYLDRQKNRLEEMAPELPEPEYPTPKLDSLVSEDNNFTDPEVSTEVKPLAEQFATKVEELDLLVRELLQGPPIPPPNVSLAELGMLVIAADKYIKMTDAQEVELSENQQQILDNTRTLVARLRS